MEYFSLSLAMTMSLVLFFTIGAEKFKHPDCGKAPERGRCRASIERWFYNMTSERCETFSWGGCDEKPNNYETCVTCMQNCSCADTTNVTSLELLCKAIEKELDDEYNDLYGPIQDNYDNSTSWEESSEEE
uniref:BPTI/Kunitz inhibitor domain-containing protein n=1 Tax=Amblyomma triste TaxID=251400 RepID=A0A023G8G2_AMBTT